MIFVSFCYFIFFSTLHSNQSINFLCCISFYNYGYHHPQQAEKGRDDGVDQTAEEAGRTRKSQAVSREAPPCVGVCEGRILVSLV